MSKFGTIGVNILRPSRRDLQCFRVDEKQRGITFWGKNPFQITPSEKAAGKAGPWYQRPWAIVHPECDGMLFMAKGIYSHCTLGNHEGEEIGVRIDLSQPEVTCE